MAGFQRPEGGWRFHFQGVKTNAPADALEATKSPYAQNIRGTKIQTVQTRPGYTQIFSTAGVAITDVRAYTALGTDNTPRYLARNTANQVYLDNNSLVATLAGTSQGAFMIPYRPNNSPQSWMYIGVPSDYQKLSAPDANNNVTAYNVGIQEPTSPPDISPLSFNFYSFSALAASWAAGGTAGAISDVTRVSDTATTAIVDPASNSKRWSVQVATSKSYQIGQLVNIVSSGGGSFNTVVEDAIPPIAAGATLTVQAIMYYAGTTGRCVIVPTQQPASSSIPTFSNNIPSAQSIYADSSLSALRRGALVRLNASETALVLNVTTGPNGTIAFEVSTAGTIAAGQAITGIPAIIVSDIDATVIGQTITSVEVDSTFTGAGTGTLTQALGTNPFIQPLAPSSNTPQEDDYIAFGLQMSDISQLVQGVIIFDVKNGGADYVTDAYYYIFNINNIILPSPLAPPLAVQNNPQLFQNSAVAQVTQIIQTVDPNIDPSFQKGPTGSGNSGLPASVTSILPAPTQPTITSLTPLPTAQWATVLIPISALTRLGNDNERTLMNCQGVRISIQTAAGVTVSLSSFWVGGGAQPDVSENTPYFYCFSGRNTATGALSNPSPIARYAVSPRRQQVLVTITDTVNDPQCNVWDVFRYGGTVTSFRYVGTVPNSAATVTFTDNYFDSAALAGDLIQYDNFEPWPTIDVPFNALAGTVAGITTTITVVGTNVLVIYSSANAFTSPAPATILRWLPGTLVTLGGQNAYTLWDRPTLVTLAAPPAAYYFAYLFQFVENIGFPAPAQFNILEPNVANQHLPYLWGPDAYGTIFGAGDPFRPGSFYFCKSYVPDSAPDTNNQELVAPSEALLGGEVINGLSLAASADRWWKLYPNFGNPAQAYQPVEAPVGRGLAAPYAHCTDGKSVFFVAKDGIWVHSGGPGSSLTDADLFNLFPHEGVNTPENYVYGTYTIYTPDYKYVSEFRLSFCDSYLYFDYRDSIGAARNLVCDLRDMDHPAWSVDTFPDSIVTLHYAVEQPESTLQSAGSRYPLLILAGAGGTVFQQMDNSNDNGVPISSVISTFEYNGGDLREDQLYNDAFLDFNPVSGLQVAVLSNGIPVVAATPFAASASRVQTNIVIGLELKYCGVLIAWTDDFNAQSTPTVINAWQPMYQGVPVSVFQWKTQKTAFGLLGYKHLRQWNFCYRSTAPVTLTVTAYDGTSPTVITLPSSAGLVVKTIFPFTFNKGMLYDVVGVSIAEWTPYNSESELYVGAWDRQGPYKVAVDWEAPVGLRS